MYVFIYTYSWKKAFLELSIIICGNVVKELSTVPIYYYQKAASTVTENVKFYTPFDKDSSCGFTTVGVSTYDGTNY